ncbi:MAG: hypothetical protein KDE53_32740, partial [Caldilineaceae bacterium]|nr:hypothetical protein [Caldilineaceae bacterium]
YEDAHYKEQNKKMPKLGSEVITPQGVGRVRHLHPLKETVTVFLESNAIAEFTVDELLSTKSTSGNSCSTCGGCTAKRRAGADDDNARSRQRRTSRRRDSTENQAERDTRREKDAKGDEDTSQRSGRRQQSNRNRSGGSRRRSR